MSKVLLAATLLAADFVNQGVKSFSDGVQGRDLFDFLDEGLQVNGIVAEAGHIKEELAGMTPEYRKEIVDGVRERLNLGDDAEEVTENLMYTVAYGYASVKAIQKIRNKPAA